MIDKHRDQALLRFAHRDLSLLARLRIRLSLAMSAEARHRLAELRRASETVAAELSPGGLYGFRVASSFSARAIAIVDAAVITAVATACVAGGLYAFTHRQPTHAAQAPCRVKLGKRAAPIITPK